MITLCCSRKARVRLGLPEKLPLPPPSTTVLGNWHVSLHHYGRLQMILAVSERSLLPVVFPAKGLRNTLERNLRAGVGGTLLALGIDSDQVDRELKEMEEIRYSTATNRKVIGSVNELAMFLGLEMERTGDLLALGLRLANTPMIGALKGKGANTHPFPDIVTRELFGLSGRGSLRTS
jgi:hypothetical protein